MKIGVNLTSVKQIPVIKKLFENNIINFCEIMIDNFFSIDILEFRTALGTIPTAFHIMNSRYLERDLDELKEYAKNVKKFYELFRPLYVSDHMARFTLDGYALPRLIDVDYIHSYDQIVDRVIIWQKLLDRTVYIENFPSILDIGKNQPEFLNSLRNDTGCEILFDISNAVLACKNVGLSEKDWENVIKYGQCFHVAGFRKSDTSPPIYIDSHDDSPSKESVDLFNKILKGSLSDNSTIVFERDWDINYENWKRDIESTIA